MRANGEPIQFVDDALPVVDAIGPGRGPSPHWKTEEIAFLGSFVQKRKAASRAVVQYDGLPVHPVHFSFDLIWRVANGVQSSYDRPH